VGARASLDRCEKSPPPPGFHPPIVQPVANRYTDYATRPTVSHNYCTDSVLALPKREVLIIIAENIVYDVEYIEWSFFKKIAWIFFVLQNF
jgi:hypothetical protein